MYDQIKATAGFIKEKTQFSPEIGIVLGTGLGGLVQEIEIAHTLAYADIPNFPVSTVEGHTGQLIFGTLGGRKVVAMKGRFHFYEGYSLHEVVFPIRVMKLLGITHLFVSNASGGVNPAFEVGDLMIINDHINMLPGNPLIGKNMTEFGPRFPDMSEAYDKALIVKAKAIAAKHHISVQEGVYLVLSGPTFETPAEYKMVRVLGADTVGMSTVPEVIAAKHAGLKCFGISIITDLGVPGKIVEVTHEEVQHVAAQAEKKMTLIMKEMISEL